MIIHRTGYLSEMRKIQMRRTKRPNLRDRVAPRFHLQLRRNEWRNRRSIADPNARNVAAENIVVPMIDMVMTGMPRRCQRANFEWRQANDGVVFQNLDPIRRNRRDFPPKPIHVVAKDPFGRLD